VAPARASGPAAAPNAGAYDTGSTDTHVAGQATAVQAAEIGAASRHRDAQRHEHVEDRGPGTPMPDTTGMLTETRGVESVPRPLAQASWPAALTILGIAIAFILALFWETAASAVQVWITSASYNHGFAILPVVAWLVWTRQPVLRDLDPRPTSWGLVILAAATAIWLLGRGTRTDLIEHVALVLMLQGSVLTVLGWSVTRALAFPLAYLFFAVPAGDSLVPFLQDVTARFVVIGLHMVGIPVYSDGVFISIPTADFEVAEACSGIRFLIATVALGTLCADQLFRAWWRRIAFVVLSVAVPVIANGFRAFGIVIIAHLTNGEVAVGVDHIVYGWLFFAFVTVVLLAIGIAMRDDDVPPAATRRDHAAPTPGDPSAWKRAVLAGIAVLLLASSGPAIAAARNQSHADIVGPGAARLMLLPPEVAAPWSRIADDETPWQPVFVGTDAKASVAFQADGQQVDHYIAYYAFQRDGAEALNWHNRVADGETWRRIDTRQTTIVADGQTINATVTRMTSRQGKRLAVHWYWVDGRFTASAHLFKLYHAWAWVRGRSEAAAAIVVSAEYVDRPEDAVRAITSYLGNAESMVPRLDGQPAS